MHADSGGPQPSGGTDLSSVITQVTTKTQPASHASFRNAKAPPPPLDQDSWSTKFRNVFCCLSNPEESDYYKTADPYHGRNLPLRPTRSEVLVGPKRPEDINKKTLVLDLDETLVHSSFKPIPNPDYIIPVDIDGRLVDVYVLKRPWLDNFMTKVAEEYEVVLFTASLAKYADPLLDQMDKYKVIRWRLFRESCCPFEGNYVKDLSCLGRDLAQTIIVDNSPHSYVFQPQNALPIGTFIDDMGDRELLDMLPYLSRISNTEDVRPHLIDLARQQQYI